MAGKIKKHKNNKPVEGVLYMTVDETKAFIIDMEGDPIDLIFNNDGCVTIDTADYTYLVLTRSNVNKIKKLLNKAEKYFETFNEQGD